MERLATPVLEAASAGVLRQRLAPRHYHRRDPNRANRLATAPLEAVCRTLLGLSRWLAETHGGQGERALRARFLDQATAALAIGCDQTHPDRFVLDRGRQPLVEMGLLAAALLQNNSVIWDRLSKTEQTNLLTAFWSVLDVPPVLNNWLLFPALIEQFLGAGNERLDRALSAHQAWYVGDGWYSDGPGRQLDWYNGIMIHPLLDILLRNATGWDSFRRDHAERFKMFCEFQERRLAADGSYPILGRSATYRVGVFHALAHEACRGRVGLTAAIKRTLSTESFRPDGFLHVGVVGEQPELAEEYITTGSCYMAAAVFLPLALPASDPFWGHR